MGRSENPLEISLAAVDDSVIMLLERCEKRLLEATEVGRKVDGGASGSGPSVVLAARLWEEVAGGANVENTGTDEDMSDDVGV